MSIFSYIIKSEYVRAIVLAQVRHLITAVGVGLVAKGYADQGLVEQAAGLGVAIVGFWLAHQDVKGVDKKIEAALNSEPPVVVKTIPVEVEPLPPVNLGGIGKAGH